MEYIKKEVREERETKIKMGQNGNNGIFFTNKKVCFANSIILKICICVVFLLGADLCAKHGGHTDEKQTGSSPCLQEAGSLV